MKDPSTDEEWTEAIAAAVFCLGLDACYSYGFMTGPPVDVERAESLLAEARRSGRPVPTLAEVLNP